MLTAHTLVKRFGEKPRIIPLDVWLNGIDVTAMAATGVGRRVRDDGRLPSAQDARRQSSDT